MVNPVTVLISAVKLDVPLLEIVNTLLLYVNALVNPVKPVTV
jgi:hypothetical protein